MRLIQRGIIRTEKLASKKGIDSLVRFEYMGSSESVLDAMPESLKKIHRMREHYSMTSLQVSHNGVSVVVIVVCDHSKLDSVVNHINELAANNVFFCKEWHAFDNPFKDNGFLWDLDKNFMFWVSKGKKKDKELFDTILDVK